MYNGIVNYRPIATVLIPWCVRWRSGFDRHRRLMLRQRHNTARQKRHKWHQSKQRSCSKGQTGWPCGLACLVLLETN